LGTGNDRLSIRATESLLRVTGYGLPVAGAELNVMESEPAPLSEADPPETESEDNAAITGPFLDVEKLTAQDRKALLRKILAWWNENGAAIGAVRRKSDEIH